MTTEQQTKQTEQTEQLEYIDNGPFKYAPLWWHKAGLRQTASGYGSKLVSAYKTKYNDRWYRVYHMCCSNVSTAYIIVQGKKKILRNTSLD
jgi:hypothetical protein